MTQAILIAQALSTVMMTGLIWTMQVVHYPLFAQVGPERFSTYQRQHMRRISWIVGPVMAVEAGTALWLALEPPAGVPPWATGVGAGLVFAIWLSTGLLQGPTHARLLRRGTDPGRLQFLLSTNWIRTICWSVRAPLTLFMLVWGASP